MYIGLQLQNMANTFTKSHLHAALYQNSKKKIISWNHNRDYWKNKFQFQYEYKKCLAPLWNRKLNQFGICHKSVYRAVGTRGEDYPLPPDFENFLILVMVVIFTLMPYPCSHFYFDINFGDRLYSKEKRTGSPLLFWI